MSLSRSTVRTMDLAAIRLGEVVEVRRGVFGLPRTGILSLFGPRAGPPIHRPPKAPTAPRATPDHFVWRRPDEPFPPIMEITDDHR